MLNARSLCLISGQTNLRGQTSLRVTHPSTTPVPACLTHQTIHTENKNFNFCKIWAVTIQHHQQGISSRDPGRSGGEGEEKRESTIFNTTNKGHCSMSTSNFCRDKFPQRDGNVVRKTKPSVSRGGMIVKPGQRDSA